MSVPDAQMYPRASAAAAVTVAQHEAPQDLIFYAGWFCPYVQRVWISLQEKGIPYHYTEVNPYHKEKHFLDINPKGLVPAVEYKGVALYESLILCEFLQDAFSNHGPAILPVDPTQRALVRIWVDHITKAVLPHHQKLWQSQEKEKQEQALKDLNEGLRKLANQIKGPYFLGEEFTLVDITIAPWILRDYVIAEHRGFSRAAVSDKWKQYADLVEKRPSVLSTISDKKHYEEIFNRYLRDEAQSEVAKATREGRAVP